MATRTLLAVGEAIRSDVKRRTSGNVTLNSTSYINLDTGLDITLTAATGDKIEVGVNGQWNNELVNGILDVATLVAGSPVTYFSSGTGTQGNYGLPGWIGINGFYSTIGGPALLTLVSGDISSGTVTLRLRARTDTATNKVLIAVNDVPFQFSAKNLGPG